MPTNPKYDLVLLGPTGYTGRFCADHIVQNHPTNLKWALAGRSAAKIDPIAKELQALVPDRVSPEVLQVQLNETELDELAKKTKIIINCVGPYHKYSSPVVEACANNGTHYLDVTGETPWIRVMVDKYHEKAKSNGSIIIHSVGVESAPADMLAWALVKRVREDISCNTREIYSCIKEMKSSGASGGTLNTIISIFDWLPTSQLLKFAGPFTLAASPPPNDLPRETFFQKLLGVRSIRDLGTLTTSPNGMADMAIVYRSSSLMPEFYGKRFAFHQLLSVRNVFIGALVHVGMMVGLSLLLLSPVRWLLRKLVYAPGNGPTMQDSLNDRLEYHAVATADQNVPTPKRVLGKLSFQGSMYVFTGLLVAEAAMVILKDEEKIKKVSRGGIVTTAALGQEYVDRLDKVGCRIETKVFEY
ncbi:hypothetical protein N7532_005041 [Penicillium argentinense]|uniref:Saccharopine dehydrogenase NADP binding domain-containing protein n=1 Tax=Penicillium argentinense TaxID=1131581 RepID=A0A9W9K9L1_9EURO|nr:uncharacterized protein N7532_005041 [Penicillium argentinense]KAJ5098040.1 hypothetical protein N7532_005041 [Penicillium argentinense]